MITFVKSVKTTNSGSSWELMMAAQSNLQANLFVRLGKNGLPLSVSPSNILGVTDMQLDTWMKKGVIEIGPLFSIMNQVFLDYPNYSVTTTFKEGIIRVIVDDEVIFGFQVYRNSYVILDAHGDLGAEYYSRDEIEARIQELFKQSKQFLLISSCNLG
jgi:hypothetical protein